MAIVSSIIIGINIPEPPKIEEVHNAAIRYLSLENSQTKSWDKNSRTQALLPRIVFEYEKRARTTLDLDTMDSVYVGSEMVNVGPSKNNYSRDAQNHQNFIVKAMWSLNELIYSKDQLNISAERRAINKERQTILGEINKLYFEHIKLRNEIMEYSRFKSLNKTKKKELNDKLLILYETKANLDALTGGWFGKNMGKQ